VRPSIPPFRTFAALFLSACASAPGPVPADPGNFSAATLAAEATAARAVVTAFIAAEASGDPADSLLTPDADFIMTGIVVARPPRLAGLNGPGTTAVESANAYVSGALAYVVVAYRFDTGDPALDERARGTFILEKQRAGWRIRHVHTSMVAAWER